jgi:hypothetical protein
MTHFYLVPQPKAEPTGFSHSTCAIFKLLPIPNYALSSPRPERGALSRRWNVCLGDH